MIYLMIIYDGKVAPPALAAPHCWATTQQFYNLYGIYFLLQTGWGFFAVVVGLLKNEIAFKLMSGKHYVYECFFLSFFSLKCIAMGGVVYFVCCVRGVGGHLSFFFAFFFVAVLDKLFFPRCQF